MKNQRGGETFRGKRNRELRRQGKKGDRGIRKNQESLREMEGAAAKEKWSSSSLWTKRASTNWGGQLKKEKLRERGGGERKVG